MFNMFRSKMLVIIQTYKYFRVYTKYLYSKAHRRIVSRLVLSTYDRRLCDLLRVYLPRHRHHHHRRRRRRHWVTVTNFAAAAVAKIRLCTFSLSTTQQIAFVGARRRRRLLPSSQTWLPWCQKLMTFCPARPGARPLPWWRHHSSWTCALSVLFFVPGKRNLRAWSADKSDKQIYARSVGRACLQLCDALTSGCWRDWKLDAVEWRQSGVTTATTTATKCAVKQAKSKIKMMQTSPRRGSYGASCSSKRQTNCWQGRGAYGQQVLVERLDVQ